MLYLVQKLAKTREFDTVKLYGGAFCILLVNSLMPLGDKIIISPLHSDEWQEFNLMVVAFPMFIFPFLQGSRFA